MNISILSPIPSNTNFFSRLPQAEQAVEEDERPEGAVGHQEAGADTQAEEDERGEAEPRQGKRGWLRRVEQGKRGWLWR